jgi:hypothetical protein
MGERWKYVQAFAEFCKREGELRVDLQDHQGRPFAAYRSGAVGLGADWGTEVLDFADRRSNLPLWDWQSGLEPLTDDELECCKRFVADNGFSWGYYGSPPEPAQLQFPNVRTVEVVEVPLTSRLTAFMSAKPRCDARIHDFHCSVRAKDVDPASGWRVPSAVADAHRCTARSCCGSCASHMCVLPPRHCAQGREDLCASGGQRANVEVGVAAAEVLADVWKQL